MRDASDVRTQVFEDRVMSRDLKLFTLAAIHLFEHPELYAQVRQFRPSPWPYRAMRMAGWQGTDEELTSRLRSLIRDDVPKYRSDLSFWPACVGVMLRPAGAPCKAKAALRTTMVHPINGERTYVAACSRHREVLETQLREARDAWIANGKPQPAVNSGGQLLCYFDTGIEELYAWADKDYTRGDVMPEPPDRPLAIVTAIR